MELPVLIVATVLALLYGSFISRKWYLALAQGAITFLCVFLCGRILPDIFNALNKYPGVAQIIGVFLSSIIIFVGFGLPAQRRSRKQEEEEDRATEEINEEDE